MAKIGPEPYIVELKYGHDEIIDDGFFNGVTYDTRRAMKAHTSISLDARMDPTQHPEIHRLMTAFFNNQLVEVHDLPGGWLVEKVEKVQHDFGHVVRFDFDLVQAYHRPRVAIEPLTPPESPEKVAARKLAKRILGYDPDAPPTPAWSTFDAELSFNELRVSFEKLAKSVNHLGIDVAASAASADKFRAQLLNSFKIERVSGR